MSSTRRFPSSVYAIGTEPDPRFSLANERTFLAWMRTTMALLAFGFGAALLDLGMPHPAQTFLTAVLAGTSIACAWCALLSWLKTERALRLGEPLPSNPANIPLIIGIALASTTLLATGLLR